MQKLNFQKVKNLKALSGMPQLDSALTGWEVPLTLVRVYQDIVEGDLVTREEKIDFMGCWQPLKDEQLEFKDPGLRSWPWIWIHAHSGTLNLNTADKIIFNGKRYKVMAVKDYSLNGFIEYHLVLDYMENPADAKRY